MTLVKAEEYLQRHFGFSRFLPGQREVVGRLLDGQSAAAIFPTGAGKSLCYQLPALLLPGLTLVVSPLLSLMKDQVDFLTGRGIPAARLDSTLSADAYNEVLDRAQKGELKILMVAVERFRNERFRSRLQRIPVSLMVVDEAHCISEWGHNFRPDYLKLPVFRKEFAIAQVLLLTATATARVREDMCGKFGIPSANVTVTGFYRPNLFLQVTPTPDDRRRAHLLTRINEQPRAPTIVYVTLQKSAEEVAGSLVEHSVNAACYHAGLASEERESIQNRFMSGQLDCVVATIAFGMGIDKRNIRRVIHYDLPKSIENYSQEIGRSGRDGEASHCEVLANRDGVTVLENFIYGDTPERSAISALLERIASHDGSVWEVKTITLSNELNIRLLPLKTLLVYLEMHAIIRPKYTSFGEYSLKYCDTAETIVGRFTGERQKFVQALLDHCHTKKSWTYADIPSFARDYATDRSRAVAALEYFAGQGWIELRAGQSVETYDILTQSFVVPQTTDTLFALFTDKERLELQRIGQLLDFFESDSCLSARLAGYFGETLTEEKCGHCSVCRQGSASIVRSVELPALDTYDYGALSDEFMGVAGEHSSAINLTRFLCGIQTPLFTRLKLKKLSQFGALERYPFAAVRQWAEGHVVAAPV